jgi:hypothetical protein
MSFCGRLLCLSASSANRAFSGAPFTGMERISALGLLGGYACEWLASRGNDLAGIERAVRCAFFSSLWISQEIPLRIIPLCVGLRVVRFGRAAFVMQIALSASGNVLLDYAGSRLADFNSSGLEFDHDPLEADVGIGSHDFGNDLAWGSARLIIGFLAMPYERCHQRLAFSETRLWLRLSIEARIVAVIAPSRGSAHHQNLDCCVYHAIRKD